MTASAQIQLTTILIVSILAAFGCRSPSAAPFEDPPNQGSEAAVSTACQDLGNILQIGDGQICGEQTSGSFPGEVAKDVWAYKGIPYAATTAGANRWRQAQPPIPWGQEILNATEFGQPCSQLVSDNFNDQRRAKGSEDCLTVNVFTPVEPPATLGAVPDQQVPVMVFIHGGAYLRGTGGQALFDGANLAGGGGVVVVTFNYRLGVLGFLGGIDTGDLRNGNFGLKDQQQALRWVRDNIAAFGGDKEQVTLFGESAGASSVGVHLVNPDSMQLFERGIMESNHYGMLFQTRQTAEARANELLDTFDCSGDADHKLRCLQAAADADLPGFLAAAGPDLAREGEALLCNAFGGFEFWAPMVDGELITAQPADTVITKPVMLGTNTNEGVFFVSLVGMYPDVPGSGFTMAAAMDLIFGLGRGTEVLSHYPDLINFSRHKGVPLAKVMTDFIWDCANNQVLNAAAAAGNEEIYGYHFTHAPTLSIYPMGFEEGDPSRPFSGNPCGPDLAVNPQYSDNVCHGNELPYIFGDPIGFSRSGQLQRSQHTFHDDERAMTAKIMGLLSHFAKHGEPGSGFPKFASSTLPQGVYRVLRDDREGGFTSTTEIYGASKCRFWQQTIEYKLNWLQELCSEHWLF